MKKQSLKSYLIDALAFSVPKSKDLETLVVLTPGGTIVGTPCSDENLTLNAKLIKTFALQYEQSRTPMNNHFYQQDGYLLLNDVTIFSNNCTKLTVSTLIVFHDQIISVAFGKHLPDHAHFSQDPEDD